MFIQHTNRAGKIYYLRERKTKAGKLQFFFSTQPEGKGVAVKEIPDGYEIYEHPENAQVFLRRKKPQLIADVEKRLVEEIAEKLESTKRYLIDYNAEFITVYESDANFGKIMNKIGVTTDVGLNKFADTSHYSGMLRFRLVDKKKRLFIAERFCFRGSIDDWIHLSGPDNLRSLSNQYMTLLGTDEFFNTPHL